MDAKLSIPTELEDKVNGWQDGETYQVSVTQTSPGVLELASVEDEGDAETKDEGGTEEGDQSKMMDEMPTKNPAIAIVMAKKSSK